MKNGASTKRLYEDLLDVARRIFTDVRFGQGQFHSGVATVKGDKILFINQLHPLEELISLISKEIAAAGCDDIYLKPRVRAEVDRVIAANDNMRNTTGSSL